MAIRYKLYADLDGQPVKAIQRISFITLDLNCSEVTYL